MSHAPHSLFDFSHAGLLIAAHGSPSTPGGRTSSRKHADTLRNLNIFADVQAGFLTEKPFVKDVLDAMDTPEVFVVPNLACAGYISTQKLPQALNLTGEVTERITSHGRQRVIVTAPVGTDPGLPKLMANRVRTIVASQAVETATASIVMIGHGSQKSRASFNHTNRLAEDLGRQALDMQISTAFLEEGPLIRDWRALTDAPTVIFLPFLISDGYHGADEIPRDIGFDAKSETFQKNLADGRINETVIDGRRLIYLPPIGDALEMAELILTRVRAAQDQAA